MVEKQLEYVLFHWTDFFFGLLNRAKKYKLNDRKKNQY